MNKEVKIRGINRSVTSNDIIGFFCEANNRCDMYDQLPIHEENSYTTSPVVCVSEDGYLDCFIKILEYRAFVFFDENTMNLAHNAHETYDKASQYAKTRLNSNKISLFNTYVMFTMTESGLLLPIANCTYTKITPNKVFIDDVSVLPHMRNKGVATAMMNHMLSDIHADGCTSATLNSVKTEAAINLYKKVGFVTDSSFDNKFFNFNFYTPMIKNFDGVYHKSSSQIDIAKAFNLPTKDDRGM